MYDTLKMKTILTKKLWQFNAILNKTNYIVITF